MDTISRPDLSAIKRELKELALAHAAIISIVCMVLAIRAVVLS